MFYLSYLRSELVRRKGRTILTVAGLSIGVALVIVISSLTRGLDHAQKTALDPLSSIGTDLTITLAPQAQDTSGGAFGGGGAGSTQGEVAVGSAAVGVASAAPTVSSSRQTHRRSPTCRSWGSRDRTSSRTSSCPAPS